MENVEIVFNKNSIYGEVQLYADGERVGKMEISVEGGKLRVYHTEVNDLYKKRGYAKKILNEVVKYARKNSLRIIPRCPFVLSQFKRYPNEFIDVR